MPRNDEGEFELILGNRQLLSVFFIVVILLGVFFTMGYIVGRNSAPLVAEVASTPKEAPVAAEPPVAPPETAAKPAAAAPIETAPQQPEPAETKKAAAAEPKAAERPESAKSAAPKSEPPATKKETAGKASKAPASTPSSGQAYLQLAATSKHEADIMVDVLRNKGFKALAAEIEEKRGTFRVLVGPIPEGATNSMRTELQGSGFPGNAAIRRVF